MSKFRPTVERLEDRMAPATWRGTVDTDWDNAANWVEGDIGDPGENVRVEIQSTAHHRLTVPAGVLKQIGGLELVDTPEDGFNAVNIRGGLSVVNGSVFWQNDGQGQSANIWTSNGLGEFNLFDSDMTWSAGSMYLKHLRVREGSSLTAKWYANKLYTDEFDIGETLGDPQVLSIFNVGFGGGDDLYGNLGFKTGSRIDTFENGRIYFRQESNTGSAGSILAFDVDPNNPQPAIRLFNRGELYRNADYSTPPSSDPNDHVLLSAKVINYGLVQIASNNGFRLGTAESHLGADFTQFGEIARLELATESKFWVPGRGLELFSSSWINTITGGDSYLYANVNLISSQLDLTNEFALSTLHVYGNPGFTVATVELQGDDPQLRTEVYGAGALSGNSQLVVHNGSLRFNSEGDAEIQVVTTNLNQIPQNLIFDLVLADGLDWDEEFTYDPFFFIGFIPYSQHWSFDGSVYTIGVSQPPPPAPQPKAAIDDGDAGFTATAGFSSFGGQGFQDDVTFAGPGSGTETATWTFSGLTPGLYRVSTTWSPDPNRATNAPFTVFDSSSPLGTVLVNQEVAPDDLFDAGSFWEDLGSSFAITSDTLAVWLTDLADEFVIADAIRIERVGDLPLAPEAIIDNGDPGFFAIGYDLATDQGYEGDVLYAGPGSGAYATWDYDPAYEGTYRVYVTWTEDPNRATNTTFAVSGGIPGYQQVTVNQQLAPDDYFYDGVYWESLGDYVIDEESAFFIELEELANDGYIIADAIMFVKVA